MTANVYILGGYQTDFSENWARRGREIADGMRDVLEQGLAATQLTPQQLDTAHVGNFAASK